MTTTKIPTMPAIPMAYQASLIFGEYADEILPKSDILSRSPGDLAIVKITHLALGKLIQEADPEEEHFHVELYETPNPPNEPHAELWVTEEWKESNTRMARLKELSTLERQANSRRDEIIAAVHNGLRARPGIDPAKAQILGVQIAAAWGKMDISSILKMLKLEEIMENFK